MTFKGMHISDKLRALSIGDSELLLGIPGHISLHAYARSVGIRIKQRKMALGLHVTRIA